MTAIPRFTPLEVPIVQIGFSDIADGDPDSVE
jgi:hypothetical protein